MNKRGKRLLAILSFIAVLSAAAAAPLTAQAEEYQYDDLGRVISVTYENGDLVEYRYDPNGNILEVKVHTAQEAEQPPQDDGDVAEEEKQPEKEGGDTSEEEKQPEEEDRLSEEQKKSSGGTDSTEEIQDSGTQGESGTREGSTMRAKAAADASEGEGQDGTEEDISPGKKKREADDAGVVKKLPGFRQQQTGQTQTVLGRIGSILKAFWEKITRFIQSLF